MLKKDIYDKLLKLREKRFYNEDYSDNLLEKIKKTRKELLAVSIDEAIFQNKTIILQSMIEKDLRFKNINGISKDIIDAQDLAHSNIHYEFINKEKLLEDVKKQIITIEKAKEFLEFINLSHRNEVESALIKLNQELE